MRQLFAFFLLTATLLSASFCSIYVTLQPGWLVIEVTPRATVEASPTWEPTPTQEHWQPTAPVFLEAVNITQDRYRVRDCDSVACEVIGYMEPGQRVEYVTSRGRWLEIHWQGNTAYVWDECCTVP